MMNTRFLERRRVTTAADADMEQHLFYLSSIFVSELQCLIAGRACTGLLYSGMIIQLFQPLIHIYLSITAWIGL